MGDSGSSLQPDLVRLLAIHCLQKSVYKLQTWGEDDRTKCETIIDVTRNIGRLCDKHMLESMMKNLQEEFGNTDSIVENLVWDHNSESLRIVDADEDHGAHITSSHIKGEAYELLCAIIFKCKGSTPLMLKNYYPVGNQVVDRDCRVTKVFLSGNKTFRNEALQWSDNHVDAKNFLDDRVGRYLKEKGAPADTVEQIVDLLHANIKDDIGFDIFVELEELEDNHNRHFLIAQCKYRSNEQAEVNMAGYVGKYYNIVNLFDKVHEVLSKRNEQGVDYVPTLFPFFWMSTESDPDSMNYFTHLCNDGRVRFYGNVAMNDDETVCNLIFNIEETLKQWKSSFRTTERHLTFQFMQRKAKSLYPHQEHAVKDVLNHYKKVGETGDNLGERVHSSIIMATGSGKTLTSLGAVTSLESDETLNLFRRVQSENIAASLHFSPMIRLVLQNAHVWLSEELARHNEKPEPRGSFKMIYYCICSLKKERNSVAFSGCTAVRLIETGNVYQVFKYHMAKGNLHYCRFFTTYQAGKALANTLRKVNLELYQKHATKCLFGVSVRDEAHTAVGRGSKSYSASLYIPTHIGLSFTASPKYYFDHLKMMFPQVYNDENPNNKEMQTYCSIDAGAIFPQVDFEVANSFLEEQEDSLDDHYKLQKWHPLDLLPEDFLFCQDESDNGPTNAEYNWAYFQENAGPSGALVFYVNDSKVICKDGDRDCFEVCLDENGDPEYFGVSGSNQVSQIKHDTKCFGVNRELTTLYHPHQQPRGFHMHDMTGLGPHNRIGPIIHKLGYAKCMEDKLLAKPRLIMLKRRLVSPGEYQKFKIDDPFYLESIFGVSNGVSGKSTKRPDKVAWRLTIGGNIVESSAHIFRSMKMLFDCFFLEKEKFPIKTALVFCQKTEQSKECKAIFDSLLEKGVLTKKLEASEKTEFFTGIIYTSDNSAQDDEEAFMAYDVQQHTLSRFCGAKRGVLFNVKLIGIGVDLPKIDAALIVNPGKSSSDITQKIGRTLRIDSKNTCKVATVLVPAWDATDNEEANIPQESTDASIVDPFSPGTSYILPTTPASRAASANRVTPPSTPGVSSDPVWYAPVQIPYENRFFLQLRVLEAMEDKNISMISSFIEGSARLMTKNSSEKDKHQTGNQLIQNLKGDGKGDPFVPTFDESLSDFLLSVWDIKEVDIRSQKRNAEKNAPHDREENRKASRAFMLVVLATCCHHRSDYEGKDITDQDQSFIWYKSGNPFLDRFSIDALKENTQPSHWELFEFPSVEEFEKAIRTKQQNVMSIKTLRDKFQKLEEEDQNEIVQDFLKRLETDMSHHNTFLEILCECLQDKFPGYSCNHQDHTICGGFGFTSFNEFKICFHRLLNWKDKWMQSVRKAASSRMNGSTCTKRKSQELSDDDDDVMSPESMEIDPNIHVHYAAGSRKSTKSVSRSGVPARNLRDEFDNANQPSGSGAL